MIKAVDEWLIVNNDIDETELSLFSIAYVLKSKKDDRKYIILRR